MTAIKTVTDEMCNCHDPEYVCGPEVSQSTSQAEGSELVHQTDLFAQTTPELCRHQQSDFCKDRQSQTAKAVASLPLFCGHSETWEAKLQLIASFLIGRFAPYTLSLSASSPVASSLVTSPSPSTPGSLAHATEGTPPSHAIENPNLHQLSTVQQIHVSDLVHLGHIRREGEFVCGWGAAFINICITFPINKTMFRQQLHGISGIRAIRQLHKDGLRFLYRGLLPPLLQKSFSQSVMFGMYFECQDVLGHKLPGLGTYANHTLAAFGAGVFEAAFTPFERIQALMQSREYHNKFANTLDALYSLRSYGLREYYRGLSAIVLRNGPSNVAFFLGREYLQIYGPQSRTQGQKVAIDFLSGACLGAVISTCCFPLNVVKIRMQCVLGGPFTGIWATLKTVMSERNQSLSGLYRGVHLNYMRSFLSWGIINASYELLMKTFYVTE